MSFEERMEAIDRRLERLTERHEARAVALSDFLMVVPKIWTRTETT